MTWPGTATEWPQRAAHWLLAGIVGLALVLAGIVVGAVPAAAQNAVGASTPVMINTVRAATDISPGQRLGKGLPQPRIVVATGVAAETEAGGVSQAFHYTSSEYAQSIAENGLRPGSYATPNGSLSPLQAQLELALPPTRALPGAKIQIDVAGLRDAGYEIPSVSRVSSTVTGPGGRVYTMPGGGYEMNFPYAIPPEFLKVVG